MKNIWKIGLIVGLLITVMVLCAGCLLPGGQTSVTSANATGGDEGSTWGSLWPMLVFLVVIFAMFYFVMIRPQRKRQKEHETMMQSLQRGDRIITAGGIYGTVDSIGEDTLVIKVEGGTTMRVARNSVALQREDVKK